MDNSDFVTNIDSQIETLALLLQSKIKWGDLSETVQNALIDLSFPHQVFPSICKLAGLAPKYKTSVFRQIARSGDIANKTRHINNLLRQNGIPVLWMKGVVNAYDLYQEPWLRPMSDIDFIVPPDRRLEALSVLIDAGFNLYPMSIGGFDVPAEKWHYIKHHFVLVDGNIAAELHFDLAVRRALRLDISVVDYLWDYTRIIDTPIGQLHCFSPELAIVVSSLNDVLQDQIVNASESSRGFKLSRTYDLYMLLRKHAIDWALVAQHAAHFQCQTYVIQSLFQLRSLFEIQFDLDTVSRVLLDSNNFKTVHKQPDLTKNYLRLRLVYKALPRRQFVSYLWERILPTPTEMRTRYQLKESDSLVRYYRKRITDYLTSILGHKPKHSLAVKRTTKSHEENGD